MQLVLHTALTKRRQGDTARPFFSCEPVPQSTVYARFLHTHSAGGTGGGLEVTWKSVSGVSTPSPTLVAPAATPVFCGGARRQRRARTTKSQHMRARGPRSSSSALWRQTAAADLSIDGACSPASLRPQERRVRCRKLRTFSRTTGSRKTLI